MSASQILFQIFSYPSNWNYQLNLLFILIAVVYLLITGPLRHRFKDATEVKGSKKAVFLTGLIVYYFAVGSPLALLTHELFTMHMLQMALMFFVVSPLLLIGIPVYLYRAVFRIKPLKAVFSFLSRPLLTVFLFNGLLSLYHVPAVFDAIMNSEALHVISHTLLMVASLFMWWSIVSPVPEMDTLRDRHLIKIALILGGTVLITPACALIIFTDTVLFERFQETSQMLPLFAPLIDQQLGGVIMKIIQEISFMAAIGTVLAGWFKSERKKDQEDLMQIEKERQLRFSENQV